MDFETFLRERVVLPAYGSAPSGLIAEHLEVIRRMEQLYGEEKSLSSEAMLKLSEKAGALAEQISAYNTSKK
jgi:hypothetical protein